MTVAIVVHPSGTLRLLLRMIEDKRKVSTLIVQSSVIILLAARFIHARPNPGQERGKELELFRPNVIAEALAASVTDRSIR